MKRALAFLTPALLTTFAAACSGNEDDRPDAAVPIQDAGVVVEEPAPVIVMFTSSSDAVGRGETVELHWKVENARIVNIFSATEVLISTTELEGTVTTLPIKNKASFDIRAAGNGLVGETIEVDAIWPAPAINTMTADPSNPYVNGFTQLTWSTENATQVSLFNNDVLLQTFQGSQAAGSVTFITITEETTVLRLEAQNPTETTIRELTLNASPMPAINYFRVSPRSYIGTSTTVTLTWETTNFTRVDLMANFGTIEGFSGAASGTMEYDISQPTYFTLQGFSGDFVTQQQDLQVAPVLYETEPNNQVTQAVSLGFSGGVVGEISGETDVDYYLVEIFPPTGIGEVRLWTRGVGPGCPVDTSIELIEPFSMTQVLIDEDDGLPTGRGGACAEISPELDEAATRLYGQYYVAVRGQRGETGEYVLFTEVNAAPIR